MLYVDKGEHSNYEFYQRISERMKLVEGSTDGINWVPYAMKTNDSEARAAASTCILKTKHTHVRIIEVKS